MIKKVEFPGVLFLGLKEIKNSRTSGGVGAGVVWVTPPPPPTVCFFFWNNPLLNSLYPNLGKIAYSGKFSKLGEKKSLIRQKKYSFKGSSS